MLCFILFRALHVHALGLKKMVFAFFRVCPLQSVYCFETAAPSLILIRHKHLQPRHSYKIRVRFAEEVITFCLLYTKPCRIIQQWTILICNWQNSASLSDICSLPIESQMVTRPCVLCSNLWSVPSFSLPLPCRGKNTAKCLHWRNASRRVYNITSIFVAVHMGLSVMSVMLPREKGLNTNVNNSTSSINPPICYKMRLNHPPCLPLLVFIQDIVYVDLVEAWNLIVLQLTCPSNTTPS